MTENIKIDTPQIKKAAFILRAINHKLRQQILKLIFKQREMTVTEIYMKLRLKQSLVSLHLSILRRAGLVRALRDGKSVFYSVKEDVLEKLHAEVYNMVKLLQ